MNTFFREMFFLVLALITVLLVNYLSLNGEMGLFEILFSAAATWAIASLLAELIFNAYKYIVRSRRSNGKY